MKLYKLASGISLSFLAYIVGTLLSSPSAIADATINTLASFDSTNGGFFPDGLVEDSLGNLFGTIQTGGTSGYGTVFKYTPGSGLSTLASFDNKTNGANPNAGLVEDSLGNLFGTTQGGGTSDKGTVFKYTPSSGLSTLASFNGTNGVYPNGGLVEDSLGNLFGTTQGGGTSDNGTVFEVSTNTQSVPEPDFVLGAMVAIGALSVRSTGKRGKRWSVQIRTPECK